MSEDMKKLSGMIAAAPTPMKPNGDLDLDRVPALVEHLLRDGIDGIYILGSTGEGVSMTSEERRQVAVTFIEAMKHRKPVIVQVGHTCVAEARELAAHAADAGADAISATPPHYFPMGSMDALIDCTAEIAAGAKALPFYYYSIPRLTGVNVDMPEFLTKAGDRIPTLAGLKFTSHSIHEFQVCLELDQGRFDCLWGSDEMLLSALTIGTRGVVGTTYNFAAPLYHEIFKSYEQGDLLTARQTQLRAAKMIRIMIRYGGLPAFKAAMGFVGMDCGPVRRPLSALSESAKNDLHRELKTLGFFEWLSRKAA